MLIGRQRMPEDIVIQTVLGSWPAILLGVFGSFVELMMPANQKVSVRMIISGFATAAFVSVLMCLLLHEVEINLAIKAVIVGVCGFSSKSVLSKLVTFSQKFLDKVLK